MHQRADVERVLKLSERGLSPFAIARQTGLPRSTLRDWVEGRLPSSYRDPWPAAEPRAEDLPDSYPYLLGMYLGDGCISRHPRDVFRLRISLDAKYPGIIAECKQAISDAVPGNRVWQGARASRYTDRPEKTCVDVGAYSKRWPQLLPQHGSGKKHERQIILTDWQREAVSEHPQGALRGLIHSDGCRGINRCRNWSHPRYSFHNLSDDILDIFRAVCALVGVHSTNAPGTVYVSRMADVATLDRFIGPKS